MENAANSENNKESKHELRARTKAAQVDTDIKLIQKGAMYKTCNRWNVSNISRDGDSIRSRYRTGNRGPAF